MYSEKVMDHFQNPRNVGEIEDASGVGTVGNAKCGDIMRIFLDIDESGRIREAKFKTFGCGAAVATSSMATELVKGKTVQEALQVTNRANDGSAGWAASRESALFPAGGGGNPRRTLGLCAEKRNCHCGSGKAERRYWGDWLENFMWKSRSEWSIMGKAMKEKRFLRINGG